MASTPSPQPGANANLLQTTDHHNHNNGGGKEKIVPLIQRSTFHRLDVYPFVFGYALLICFDYIYCYNAVAVNLHSDDAIMQQPSYLLSLSASASTVAILIDILYLTLLILQLIIFLKCQWDPISYAKVAYLQYKFHPIKNNASSGSSGAAVLGKNVNENNDERSRIEIIMKQKVIDMQRWTHCLVIPPNPYNIAESTNGKSNNNKVGQKKKKKTNTSMQNVRPEKPGIVPVSITASSSNSEVTSYVASVYFRGWTYRCCCNINNNNTKGMRNEKIDDHYDLPMESIWHQQQTTLSTQLPTTSKQESSSSSSTTSFTSTSTSTYYWEPQFHRLNFPTSLPLQYYSPTTSLHSVKGHHTHSTPQSISSTSQIYGTNITSIPLPPYTSLLVQQLLQPMFLFQLLCVSLWCLDEYWIYAIYTLGTLVLFECIQAFNRWKSVKRLREEVSSGDGDDGSSAATGGGGGAKKGAVVQCYRMGEWITLPTSELIVGDVISLISPSIHNKKEQQAQRSSIRNVHDHDRGYTIPADLLLLNGRAVVNEAMLTGESVPQVKEAIEIEEEGTEKLDISEGGGGTSATHKRSVLFGGTVLMDHHSSSDDNDDNDEDTSLSSSSIPTPPNQGLLCFVLRTGFDTIQGSLLRTLAYHAESGSGGNGGGGEGVNAKETLIFLLILLLCALASAATVVQHAWGDVTRNHFKLILHIIIIITSVIPPELPMELSLAVTTSLSELVKRYQIYCTEPFRIPLAGLVDTCCFDKTGTLTSDELRLHGVRLPAGGVVANEASESSAGKKTDDDDLILFDDILSKDKSDSSSDAAQAIIRSVLPRETLRVMVGCQSLAVTHVFVPGRSGRTEVQTELCGDPLEIAVMEGCGFTIHPRTEMVVERGSLTTTSASSSNSEIPPSSSIKVLHRFAFSSKLRRMSVLATDDDGNSNSILWALTKGAPEALKPMLDVESLPDDYEKSYLAHMTLGRRVLALAYRNLGKNTPATLAKWKSSRDKVEQKLIFAGLLIMDSPLKADSARVIKELRGGDQQVVMCTGDAMLTAAEVARRVGIVDATQECTYELCHDQERERFVFRPLDHSVLGADAKNDDEGLLLYTPSNYSKLETMVRERKANFCVTGDVLTKLATHAVVEVEASLIQKSFALDDRAVLNHPAARSALSDLVPIVSVFARHAPRHKEAVIAAFNESGRHTLMCGDGTNDVGALKKAHVGVSIISVPDLEAKQRSANIEIDAARREEKKERKAAKKAKSSSSSTTSANRNRPKKSRADRVNRSLQALAEAEEELNFVSLGNASVASPFTSRKTSVRCCKDILQQGRCTLVTMIQIYKILGVQCLVNALVLTTLHQKGVKQGDRQMTAVGVVVALLFLFVTRGKPLPKLSKQKPPSSVLCTETLISITIQFAIHYLAIMAVTVISDAYVDPYDPSQVPDGPFNPNTLNTATFLVTVISTINTFLVNYRGRPYMESLSDNTLLFRSIQGCYFVLFVCALEVFPPLNQLMQLSPLPTAGPPIFDSGFGEGSGYDDDSHLVREVLLGAVNSVGFKAMLCVVMLLDTAMVTSAETVIRSVLGSS